MSAADGDATSGVATATFGVADTSPEEFAVVGYTARIPGKSSIKITDAIVPMPVSRLIVWCINHADMAAQLIQMADQLIADAEGSAKNTGGPIP